MSTRSAAQLVSGLSRKEHTPLRNPSSTTRSGSTMGTYFSTHARALRRTTGSSSTSFRPHRSQMASKSWRSATFLRSIQRFVMVLSPNTQISSASSPSSFRATSATACPEVSAPATISWTNSGQRYGHSRLAIAMKVAMALFTTPWLARIWCTSPHCCMRNQPMKWRIASWSSAVSLFHCVSTAFSNTCSAKWCVIGSALVSSSRSTLRNASGSWRKRSSTSRACEAPVIIACCTTLSKSGTSMGCERSKIASIAMLGDSNEYNAGVQVTTKPR
mmetsp:Transcript_54175/g.166712  ORF Transcript_54175/g.166712 Transcript_54175/m.166712 type:complete len:274 (+) Transcript_54175:2205-3026(+)